LEQITKSRPWRRTILQFSQIRLTLARTFMAHPPDLHQRRKIMQTTIVASESQAAREIGLEFAMDAFFPCQSHERDRPTRANRSVTLAALTITQSILE
jgi:hypothetical protein